MLRIHNLLFKPGHYQFRTKLEKRFKSFDIDLLVLDYIVIDPKWRKLKVGLLAAKKMIDLLGGGCGLVVSEIAPLLRKARSDLGVPAAWIPRTKTKEDRAVALLSLRRYYRQMGFTRLGRTPYYALSTAIVMPSAEDLLKPEVPEAE